MAEKKSSKNFGWEKIEGPDGLSAEKTVSFGNNPLKTHRLYGRDEAELQASIEAFEERLKAANGEDDG